MALDVRRDGGDVGGVDSSVRAAVAGSGLPCAARRWCCGTTRNRPAGRRAMWKTRGRYASASASPTMPSTCAIASMRRWYAPSATPIRGPHAQPLHRLQSVLEVRVSSSAAASWGSTTWPRGTTPGAGGMRPRDAGSFCGHATPSRTKATCCTILPRIHSPTCCFPWAS